MTDANANQAESIRVAESYRWCRRLCRESRSSFFHSFGLLTPPRRTAMYALYAFSRITDDLGDNTTASLERRQLLSDWQADLNCALASQSIPDRYKLPMYQALWPGLRDAVRRYDLPLKVLQDIATGVSMDLDHAQPRDWVELQDYCYHVASAVGIACAHIWRDQQLPPTQAIIDCGYAFQLTNIIRDVAEDARSGRIYIPQTLFEEFGVDRSRWLASEPNGDWQSMIYSVGDRARDFFRSGWDVKACLSPDGQRMFSLMWRTYSRLLDRLLIAPPRLWQPDRMRLPIGAKAFLIISHYVPPFYRCLAAP